MRDAMPHCYIIIYSAQSLSTADNACIIVFRAYFLSQYVKLKCSETSRLC